MNARAASSYIAPTTNLETIVFKNGGVDDIVEVILFADKVSKGFTKELAPRLRGNTDIETLQNIFDFTNQNFKYVRDRIGKEVVKSPGKFWRDRKGDCKSYSVFIGSMLKNLGFKYKYRVAFYDPKEPDQGHIYPVVTLRGGQKVVMDAIPLNQWQPRRKFNQEVRYWKAYDYFPVTNATQFEFDNVPSIPVAANISGAQVGGFWKDMLTSAAFFAGFFLVGSAKSGTSAEDYMLPRLLGLGAGYFIVKAIAKKQI